MKNQTHRVRKNIMITTLFLVIFLVFEVYMIFRAYINDNFWQILLICILSLIVIHYHNVFVKFSIYQLSRRKILVNKSRKIYRIEKIFDMMDAQENPQVVVDYYNVHVANFSAFEGFNKMPFLKRRIELYAQLKVIQAEADNVFHNYPESFSKMMALSRLAERKMNIDKEAKELLEEVEELVKKVK